jgi:mono/diheme cytochrome c family protein
MPAADKPEIGDLSEPDEELVKAGRTQFHKSCWMCHGDTAVNHGGVPDLRYSQAIMDPAVFRSFVIEGVAEPWGCPISARTSPRSRPKRSAPI